jgi:hypothetical protein
MKPYDRGSMKTLNAILLENNGIFPFLAARKGAEWSVVYDRVRYSNENDDDAKPEEATPVKNGYFYGVDPRETMISLMAPDMAVWERWTPVRRAGQLRDVFNDHQTTCDSCGLDTGMCRAASQIRRLCSKVESGEPE